MTDVAPAPPTILVAGRPYPLTLSSAEAAAWLDTSPLLLQRERGKGTLPVEPVNLGKRLRWPTLKVAQAAGLPVEIVANGGPAVADTEAGDVHAGGAPDAA